METAKTDFTRLSPDRRAVLPPGHAADVRVVSTRQLIRERDEPNKDNRDE